ncbi:MAG: bifunctional riboflavin kinase/FAD synthetase [Thermotogota bacterium]
MSKRNSLTLGIFDGVHIGHRRLIEKTKEVKNKEGKAILLTFAYPANYYLNKGSFPGLIYTPRKREEIIKTLGIDSVVFLDFKNFYSKTPLEFVSYISENFTPSELTVGFNFHFGKDRIGNSQLLSELGHRFGFRTNVIPAVNCSGHRVSSSLIRYYLKNGDVNRANEVLKRPYSIEGKVYQDQGIGKKLGFPTANLKREGKEMLIPSYGVYLAYTPELGFGLLNIGKRPTVSCDDFIRYEIHYLNGHYQLYDKRVECFLLDFIRAEQKFNTINELVQQISQDRKMAYEIIQQHNIEDGWWKHEIE